MVDSLENRRYTLLLGQLRVGEPLADDLAHGKIKAVRIVQGIIFGWAGC